MSSILGNIRPFASEEKALEVFTERASILTQNMANASTPNYKARDLNFQSILHNTNTKADTVLNTSHANHLQPKNLQSGHKIYYRNPMQQSLDGNTVDNEVEKKSFIENTLRYQASLSFIQSKKSSLLKAIKGD